MRLTVLGGCGAWPAAGQACSGYLVEHDGFRLLLYPGYAAVPRLLGHLGAGEVDAVFVTHSHPDHCADLNPLLRARALSDSPAAPLPVYSLPGALDAVLELDRRMLAGSYSLQEFDAGDRFGLGPFSPRRPTLMKSPAAAVAAAASEYNGKIGHAFAGLSV